MKKPTLATGLIALILLVGVGGLVLNSLQTHPFNGIRSGGTIIVNAPSTSYGSTKYPTIVLKTGKEEITTTFVRCITVKPPLATTGYLTWQLVSPAGTPGIISPPTHSIRKHTCQNILASHPIPKEVLARILQLKEEGNKNSIWTFFGQVHAERSGPTVTTYTNSDPFLIVDEIP